MAPADGEITHGSQLQQERVVKVRNSHPVVKPQEKSYQMRVSHMVQMWDLRPVINRRTNAKFTHGCNWPNGDICWLIPFGGTMSSRTSEETASPQS